MSVAIETVRPTDPSVTSESLSQFLKFFRNSEQALREQGGTSAEMYGRRVELLDTLVALFPSSIKIPSSLKSEIVTLVSKGADPVSQIKFLNRKAIHIAAEIAILTEPFMVDLNQATLATKGILPIAFPLSMFHGSVKFMMKAPENAARVATYEGRSNFLEKLEPLVDGEVVLLDGTFKILKEAICEQVDIDLASGRLEQVSSTEANNLYQEVLAISNLIKRS